MADKGTGHALDGTGRNSPKEYSNREEVAGVVHGNQTHESGDRKDTGPNSNLGKSKK